MRNTLLKLATATLFATVAASVSAAQQSTAVTSTVKDAAADQTPYHIRSDSSLSTGSQVYVNGVDSVVSQLQSTDEWELSVLSSATRRMYIEFIESAGGAGAPQGAFYPSRIVTKCYELGNYRGYPAVGNLRGVGSTIDCPAVFRFDASASTYYQVWMDSALHPGTDSVHFTCTAVAGADQSDPNAACTAWNAEPSGLGGKNVAEVIRFDVGRHSTVQTVLGDYYMTFFINIAR